MKEFGALQPIVVDEDNVIIAGHTRYRAAMSLGWNEFPVGKRKGNKKKSEPHFELLTAIVELIAALVGLLAVLIEKSK